MNQNATINNNPSRYDAKTFKYLQSHKVFSLFETLLLSLVANRPNDPSVFLVEQLRNFTPIRVQEDVVIDLAAHNQNILQTIKSLVSHGLSPTPSFFALFATASNTFLPGINEEFKDDDVDIPGVLEYQQVQQPKVEEEESMESESWVNTTPDQEEDQPRVEGANDETTPTTPQTIQQDESTIIKLRSAKDEGQADDTNTKPHKPKRRVKQSASFEGPVDDHLESNGRDEALPEESTESPKVKRGKRTAKSNTKLKAQDTVQDKTITEESENTTNRGLEQSATITNNDNTKISNNNSSFATSYTINATPSTSNSNLLSTDNTPLKSLHQPADKSQLPTIAPVKKTTNSGLEGEPQESEPTKPKPSKFESNTLSKLRYLPQQLPHLVQPIRLQKGEYEQQKLESQLKQQVQQQNQLQLQRPQLTQSNQQSSHLDSAPLLLHNQLYPQAGEVTLQPSNSNIAPNSLQKSQKTSSQIIYPQNQRGNSIQQINATQNSESTQNTQSQSAAYQMNQQHLSLSHQHPHQPIPQQLDPLNPNVSQNQRRNSAQNFESTQQNPHIQNATSNQQYLSLAHQHLHSQPTSQQLDPQRRNSLQQIPSQNFESPQQNTYIQNATYQINQQYPSLSYQHLHSQSVFQQVDPPPPANSHQISGLQFSHQFAHTNPPPHLSLQSSNNSQAQHLPKLTSSTNPSDASHLPSLTDYFMPSSETPSHLGSQQLPHIHAQNQLPALQRQSGSQSTLPDLSQTPQKSASPRQRLHRVNTPYYLHNPDTPQDMPLESSSSFDTGIPSRADVLLCTNLPQGSQANLPSSSRKNSSSNFPRPSFPPHTDGAQTFSQPPDFLMHSAPLFQGTTSSSWTPYTGTEQWDDDHLDRMASAPVEALARSMTNDIASPHSSQPTVPTPAFRGVHYHARPRSPHSRRKHSSTTSPIQINAHTQCNHAHRSPHAKLTRAQSR